MTELKKICDDEGLGNVTTYLASGNVICRSDFSASDIQMRLERGLAQYLEQHIDVVVKSLDELSAVFEDSPYKATPPQHTYTLFLNREVGLEDLAEIKGQKNEKISPGHKVIYIHYPDGMGRSKMIIPQAKTGTTRNMNTVGKLIHLAGKL